MTEGFQAFQARRIDNADTAAQDESAKPAALELAEGVSRWQIAELTAERPVRPGAASRFVPEFDDGPEPQAEPAPELQPDLESITQAAYDEGFAKGLADAEAQSRQLLADQSQKLQMALAALQQPQSLIDAQLEEELMQMTLCLAEQLLRRQLTLDPGLLKQMIEQSIKRLPTLSGRMKVHVNPDDAEVLRELCTLESEEDWRIVVDPAVSQGGYRIESGDASLDDTVEARLAGLVERMSDDEGLA